MTNETRREFLRAAMEAAGAATALNVMPLDIRQAFAIPVNNRHGSIEDIEHIVVLMQENRSFDHYFGTLRGVRGYDDKAAVKLRNGNTVFHPDTANLAWPCVHRRPAARLAHGSAGLQRRPL